jgi:hypothetical protein
MIHNVDSLNIRLSRFFYNVFYSIMCSQGKGRLL